MKELIPIFLFSIILAVFSEMNSIYKTNEFGNRVYIKKDYFFYTILTIGLILFAGLRTFYNDTITYIQGYNTFDINTSLLEKVSVKLGDNPGFNLVSYIFKFLGFSTQSFLMFFSAITIGIYMWFFRKYSNNVFMTVFMFLTVAGYIFVLAAIKQCVAMAFCLIATHYAIEKKWKNVFIWILIAIVFHPYAIMYAVLFFLNFAPWTTKTYLMISIFCVVGFCLEFLLGTIINITSMMGEEYNASYFFGNGVNFFRLIIVAVPVVISFVVKEHMLLDNERKDNYIINLVTLNAAIMFVALFGTANYFARLANYFLPFQAVAVPRLLGYFKRNSKIIAYLVAILGYLFYFYYDNVIAHPFDVQFNQIGLFEYLSSLF